MPGNLTNYLENKLIDHFLGTTTYASATTIYVGLFTSAPGETGGGTEVSGGSYARQSATFGAATNGSTTNNTNVDYLNMPAASVVSIGIFDAATSGNMLLYGALTTPKTTDAGDTLRIASGSLTISID